MKHYRKALPTETTEITTRTGNWEKEVCPRAEHGKTGSSLKPARKKERLQPARPAGSSGCGSLVPGTPRASPQPERALPIHGLCSEEQAAVSSTTPAATSHSHAGNSLGHQQLLPANRQWTDSPFSPLVMRNGFGFALNATKKTDRRRTLKEREMFVCTQRLTKATSCAQRWFSFCYSTSACASSIKRKPPNHTDELLILFLK